MNVFFKLGLVVLLQAMALDAMQDQSSEQPTSSSKAEIASSKKQPVYIPSGIRRICGDELTGGTARELIGFDDDIIPKKDK